MTDIADIKKKSLAGMVALTSRTFVLQIIAFGSTLLLTIFLAPSVFGIFYVVSAIISFLSYFSDIGLAAALIQKKEELTDEDLATTFTVQEILVGILVCVSLLFSSQIATFYRLDVDGMWLFRALVLSFFLSSLKTIPSVILERNLEFGKLVIPQILETICFYGVAVFAAWQGLGIVSFTWAVLVRSIVGLTALYFVAPWRVRVGISSGVARKLLRFGVPFQMNSFLALVKDDLLTVVLGKILPFAAMGYIGWAKKWAEIPLRLIMDSVIRVTFPAFSRLQANTKLLGGAIEKTLFGLSVSIFPITLTLMVFIHPIVSIIPRYSKWEPALTSFYLFAIASAVASLSTPLTNALNAVGKINVTLWLMLVWTTTTWVLTLFLVRLIGFNGVALALLIITATIGIVVVLVKRITPFSFWSSIRGALMGTFLFGAWYGVFWAFRLQTLWWLVVAAASGAILYLAVLWYLEYNRFKTILTQLRSIIVWKH